MNISRHSGFTLIELMVAITLGLLVTAAAIQLYITGITSYNLQKAMTHIQDSTGFGINYILEDIRKANLSSPTPSINDETAYAGILLNSTNLGEKIRLNCADCFDNGTIKQFGDANVANYKNDQLIIRYQAPQTSYDCAGAAISTGQYVIERYFVGASSSDSRQSLRCQSVQYTQAQLDAATSTNPLNLSLGMSQIIIPKVDYFYIKLGYINGSLANPSQLAYTDITGYLALSKVKKNVDGIVQNVRPYIDAVQIGLLVQSNESAGSNSIVKSKNTQPFNILDRSVTLKAANQDTYLRQVVSQTILLRNAIGWVTEGCDSSITRGCTGVSQ